MTLCLLKEAFERDTHKQVISIRRCANLISNINHAYRIETEDKPYIMKLYRSPGYPEEGKLLLVAERLAGHSIPHAAIYSYSSGGSDFPNGYIIEECLPGITADRLALSEEETCKLYQRLAALVSEIHKIKFARYGFIIDGEPDCATFTQHLEENFIYAPNRMQSAYTDAQLEGLKRVLIERLRPCDDIEPCLCHNDIQLKNMLIDGGGIALIDWDDARAFPAVVDIARLTLLMELAYDNERPEDKRKAGMYRRAFLDNYTFDDGGKIYRELEPALHVWHGLVLLNFCSAKKPQFGKIKTMLDQKIELL